MSPDMANVSASPQFSSVLVVVVTVVAVVLLLLSQLLALRFLGLPLNVILVGFYGFLKHSTTFYVNAIYLLFRHSPCYLASALSFSPFLSLPFSQSPFSQSPFHNTPAAVMCLAVSQRTFCLVFSNSNSRVVSCVCVCCRCAASGNNSVSSAIWRLHTHTHTRTPFAEDTCDALALSLRTFCQTISGAQTVCAPLYQCTVEQLGEEVHNVNICT